MFTLQVASILLLVLIIAITTIGDEIKDLIFAIADWLHPTYRKLKRQHAQIRAQNITPDC